MATLFGGGACLAAAAPVCPRRRLFGRGGASLAAAAVAPIRRNVACEWDHQNC